MKLRKADVPVRVAHFQQPDIPNGDYEPDVAVSRPGRMRQKRKLAPCPKPAVCVVTSRSFQCPLSGTSPTGTIDPTVTLGMSALRLHGVNQGAR